MATYPASLATHAFDPVAEVGAITPTHGGMVAGHEFDIPISQKSYTTPPSTQPQTPAKEHPEALALPANGTTPTATPAAPPSQGATPRRPSSANRPRPVSMPPQSYAASGNERDGQHGQDTPRHGQRTEGQRTVDGSSSSRARGSSRILGDYTLSKTLGAGSMGKVKLAHHNLTGEKVRKNRRCRRSFSHTLCGFSLSRSVSLLSRSLLSKSCRASHQAVGCNRLRVLKLPRSKRLETPRRRSGRCGRLLCRCSCTTPTSAGCGR